MATCQLFSALIVSYHKLYFISFKLHKVQAKSSQSSNFTQINELPAFLHNARTVKRFTLRIVHCQC